MVHSKYRQYEEQYLESVASELCLTGEYRLFFIKRSLLKFDIYNKNTLLVKDSQFLKAVFPNRDEQEDFTFWAEAENKLKETLRKAKVTIKQKNWKYNDKDIVSWKDLINFLRNSHFKSWLSNNQSQLDCQPMSTKALWRQLWDRVTTTTGITIKNVTQPEVLDLSWDEEKEQIPEFKWENKLVFEINLPKPGYFILLSRFASGKIYCLSPSFLSKHFHYNSGIIVFPEHPKKPYLKVTKESIGTEEMIALIASERPNLPWLPLENQQLESKKPMELDATNLSELLNSLPEGQEIIGTRYLIVP